SANDQVGPVGVELANRHAGGLDAMFQLLDQVLLLAAGVVFAHDRGGTHELKRDIGDVEEVANLVNQPELALGGADPLAQEDEPTGLLSLPRPILDLGDVLLLEGQIAKSSLLGDGRLDVFAASPLGGLLSPLERLPGSLGKPHCPLDKARAGIHTEDEFNAPIRPAIEVGREGKVSVSPQPYL